MENDMLIYGDLLFDNFDELLDFSNEEAQILPSSSADVPPDLSGTTTDHIGALTSDNVNNSSGVVGSGDDPFICDDLDIAEMEWLSNFVEESFSPPPATILTVNSNPMADGSWKQGIDDIGDNGVDSSGIIINSRGSISIGNEEEEELLYNLTSHSPLSVLEQNGILVGGVSSGISTTAYSSSSSSSPTSSYCSGVIGELNGTYPYPPGSTTEQGRGGGGPRTKRARSVSFPNLSEAFLPSLDGNAYAPDDQPHFSEPSSFVSDPIPGDHKKKTKKLKIKFSQPITAATATNSESAGDARKCLHCGIQKTPQWRAGPMGPKTLCNACGVRYKSGRLFPEYRPAASPTFVSSLHSNSHKKVVEMRMNSGEKEEEGSGKPPKQVSSKCCELLNYIRDSKEWGGHEGRKDRGLAV